MKLENILLVLFYIVILLLILCIRENECNMLALLSLSFIIIVNLYKVNIPKVLILATLFCIVEYICVKYNIWKYNYTIYYIPYWLFFAWALAIVFIIRFYLFFFAIID
jgi:hypothetical protein